MRQTEIESHTHFFELITGVDPGHFRQRYTAFGDIQFGRPNSGIVF
jgi:hypothetical protein